MRLLKKIIVCSLLCCSSISFSTRYAILAQKAFGTGIGDQCIYTYGVSTVDSPNITEALNRAHEGNTAALKSELKTWLKDKVKESEERSQKDLLALNEKIEELSLIDLLARFVLDVVTMDKEALALATTAEAQSIISTEEAQFKIVKDGVADVTEQVLGRSWPKFFKPPIEIPTELEYRLVQASILPQERHRFVRRDSIHTSKGYEGVAQSFDRLLMEGNDKEAEVTRLTDFYSFLPRGKYPDIILEILKVASYSRELIRTGNSVDLPEVVNGKPYCILLDREGRNKTKSLIDLNAAWILMSRADFYFAKMPENYRFALGKVYGKMKIAPNYEAFEPLIDQLFEKIVVDIVITDMQTPEYMKYIKAFTTIFNLRFLL